MKKKELFNFVLSDGEVPTAIKLEGWGWKSGLNGNASKNKKLFYSAYRSIFKITEYRIMLKGEGFMNSLHKTVSIKKMPQLKDAIPISK